MINVSAPQHLYDVDPSMVSSFVTKLHKFGLDAHEFATEYVNRTAELGYAPDLGESILEFAMERLVA